jgi:hypothetical protein
LKFYASPEQRPPPGQRSAQSGKPFASGVRDAISLACPSQPQESNTVTSCITCSRDQQSDVTGHVNATAFARDFLREEKKSSASRSHATPSNFVVGSLLRYGRPCQFFPHRFGRDREINFSSNHRLDS